MRFRLLNNGIDIGGSNLERPDASMGIAQGVFAPSANYPYVQPVFRLYTDAVGHTGQDAEKLNTYYAAYKNLNLTLVTASGEIVLMDRIHITDYFDELGECELTIVAADCEVFAQHFEADM